MYFSWFGIRFRLSPTSSVLSKMAFELAKNDIFVVFWYSFRPWPKFFRKNWWKLVSSPIFYTDFESNLKIWIQAFLGRNDLFTPRKYYFRTFDISERNRAFLNLFFDLNLNPNLKLRSMRLLLSKWPLKHQNTKNDKIYTL